MGTVLRENSNRMRVKAKSSKNWTTACGNRHAIGADHDLVPVSLTIPVRRRRNGRPSGPSPRTTGTHAMASVASASSLWPPPQRRSTPSPQDEALHEKFYSTWYMPDNPAKSCCNKADCYRPRSNMSAATSTAAPEDGNYILIPAWKIERNRDNPDGRNHLCAPSPTLPTRPTPYSASHWEAAHEVRLVSG